MQICVCVVEHIILTGRKLIKTKAYGAGSNSECTLTCWWYFMKKSQMYPMCCKCLRMGSRWAFVCMSHTTISRISSFSSTNLFLYFIFTVWMLDVSFHIAIKEISGKKNETLNKSNNKIWFQDYFPWLQHFLSESFFLEQLTYHYCFPCFRIFAFQKCPIHPWTKKGTCLQRPGFFF